MWYITFCSYTFSGFLTVAKLNCYFICSKFLSIFYPDGSWLKFMWKYIYIFPVKSNKPIFNAIELLNKDVNVFNAYVSLCKTKNPKSTSSVNNVTWLWLKNFTYLFCSSVITVSIFIWVQNHLKILSWQESQLCEDN